MPDDDTPQRRPGRAIWSGTITFGLVSIPVDLVSAIRARETSMKMVDTKGHPLGREYYCPKDDKALAPDDIVRGYETESGKMVVVTDEELASVSPESSRDIDLQRFVPIEQITPTYFQRPYILAPAGKSSKAYHLLAETMARSGRVGIGTFVMRDNEYLVAILSDGVLLRAQTLRFAEEVRSPQDAGLPKPKKGAAKAAKAFGSAIDALMRDGLDMEELSDRYAEAIHAVVASKEKKGKDVVHGGALKGDDTEPESAEVIDLVKLLRERLSANAKVTTADQVPQGSFAVKSGRKSGIRKMSATGASPTKTAAKKGAKPPDDDLAGLSKQALYDRAQSLGIEGRSKMGRAALIAAIRQAA